MTKGTLIVSSEYYEKLTQLASKIRNPGNLVVMIGEGGPVGFTEIQAEGERYGKSIKVNVDGECKNTLKEIHRSSGETAESIAVNYKSNTDESFGHIHVNNENSEKFDLLFASISKQTGKNCVRNDVANVIETNDYV